MSYILDALQRADAERTRGGVPTLHARPLGSAMAQPPLNTGQRMGLTLAALLAAGVLVAGWWLWPSAPQPGVVLTAPAPAPAPAPTPAPLLTASAPTAAQPQPNAVPPATRPLPVLAAIAPPKPAESGPKASNTSPNVATSAPPRAAAPAGPAAPAAQATETPAPTPSLAPLLSELPEALRRQIPAMAITGAVYSDNPAQRLLLVNGQVLNQGSQVATDLTVVEIRTGMTEFSFRGTRFRMAH